MKNRDINLSPKPVLPWKPIPWDKLPSLPWPHKMIAFAQGWSSFYPCKQCGFCCQNPPMVKIKDNKAYYLPKNEYGTCIMYDRETRLCKIYDYRPIECRLLVCRVPESVKTRLEHLLIRYLTEYADLIEEMSSNSNQESIESLFPEFRQR